MADKQFPSSSPTRKEPVDLTESVAGEEDPGASLDATQDSSGSDETAAVQGHLRPGDEAPAGTPGSGETVCPRCGGSGKLGASSCPECEGTGKVTVGIGGA